MSDQTVERSKMIKLPPADEPKPLGWPATAALILAVIVVIGVVTFGGR